MKHSLLAAALLVLTLSACGKKDEVAAAPAMPVMALPAAAAPAAPAAPVVEVAATPADASKPADTAAAGTPDAALKNR